MFGALSYSERAFGRLIDGCDMTRCENTILPVNDPFVDNCSAKALTFEIIDNIVFTAESCSYHDVPHQATRELKRMRGRVMKVMQYF